VTDLDMAIIRKLTENDLAPEQIAYSLDRPTKQIQAILHDFESLGYAARLDYNQYTLTR